MTKRARSEVSRTNPNGFKNWFGCGTIMVLTVVGTVFLLANELFLDDGEELSPDEQRAQRLIDGPTPDTVRAAVDPVREHNAYVDPVLEPVAATGMLDGRVQERIDEIGVPVYVAQLPMHDDDGSAGDVTIAVRQLADAVGRDGVYIVVDENGDRLDTTTRGDYPNLLLGTSVLDTLDDLESEYDRYQKDHGPGGQIRNGLGVGLGVAGAVCGLVYALWWLLRRRTRSVGAFE